MQPYPSGNRNICISSRNCDICSPEVGLELGLAELRLEYFRDRFEGGDRSLALCGRVRLTGLVLGVDSGFGEKLTDFEDAGLDIEILS